jgi:dTDP-4-amino-4,6-dideoxygalactose transaminase
MAAAMSHPVSEAVAGRLLSLPLYPRMSDDDVALVVDCVSDSIRTAQGRAS